MDLHLRTPTLLEELADHPDRHVHLVVTSSVPDVLKQLQASLGSEEPMWSAYPKYLAKALQLRKEFPKKYPELATKAF